jgi:hypothetical protein
VRDHYGGTGAADVDVAADSCVVYEEATPA